MRWENNAYPVKCSPEGTIEYGFARERHIMSAIYFILSLPGRIDVVGIPFPQMEEAV